MRYLSYAGTIVVAVTAAACGGGTPTSPSELVSAPMTLNQTVNGDFGGTSRTRVITPADSAFVSFQANVNFTLAQLGWLAHQRGDRRLLKAFGLQLYQDFSDAQEDLTDAAGEVATRSAAFDSADLATFNQLRGMSGSEFDQLFLTTIIAELTSNRSSAQRFTSPTPYAQEAESRLSRALGMARDLETHF